MDKEFFDRQMRVGLDFDPLTKDWSDDDKTNFVNHMSAHILNNWAMSQIKSPEATDSNLEAQDAMTPLKRKEGISILPQCS